MKNFKGIIIIAFALIAGVLTGCGNQVAPPVTTAVAGNAVKGPFVAGSTVTATKLNADGTATTTTATSTTTDAKGSYTLNADWSGLTEVKITGKYLDETDGSEKDGTVIAVIVLPALSTTGTSNAVTANPNIASTMSASVAKSALAANPDADPATTLENSDAAVSSALGLPAGSDLASLNILEPGAANAQLLVVSAVLQDAVNKGAAADVAAFAETLATDVKEGKKLGATSGKTATIETSQTAVAAAIATIVANVESVKDAGDAAVTVAEVETASTEVTASIQTTLKGLAMSGNAFTVGTQNFTVATTGVATTTSAATPASNVVFGFTLQDLSGKTGSTTYNATLLFGLSASAATDARQVKGSVPVTVVTDGAGAVSMTVAANAVLTFDGTDANNVNVSGTATNVVADTIQNTASAVTIDVSGLLTKIQTKLGTESAAFNILGTVGLYAFTFGITGVDIGLTDGAVITQLFPLDTSTNLIASGSRTISGTLETK